MIGISLSCGEEVITQISSKVVVERNTLHGHISFWCFYVFVSFLLCHKLLHYIVVLSCVSVVEFKSISSVQS